MEKLYCFLSQICNKPLISVSTSVIEHNKISFCTVEWKTVKTNKNISTTVVFDEEMFFPSITKILYEENNVIQNLKFKNYKEINSFIDMVTPLFPVFHKRFSFGIKYDNFIIKPIEEISKEEISDIDI